MIHGNDLFEFGCSDIPYSNISSWSTLEDPALVDYSLSLSLSLSLSVSLIIYKSIEFLRVMAINRRLIDVSDINN